MNLARKMEIEIFNERYKDVVYDLHKLALIKENAFIGKGTWDDDLRNIDKVYLKNGIYLLGFINKELVAMGAYRIVTDDTAEVKRMRVHPDFQRKGLGQKIYIELEKYARKKKIKYFVLDTSTKQEAAQNFYKKNGFKEIKREKFELLDCDLIYYKKKLK